MPSKHVAWFDDDGNLVINIKRTTIVYFASGKETSLFFRGSRITDLYSMKIEETGGDYPKLTIEPAERDDD